MSAHPFAIGLDLGSKLGWAIRSGDSLKSGVRHVRETVLKNPEGERFLTILRFFRSLLEDGMKSSQSPVKDGVVFYENVEFLAQRNGLYQPRLYFGIRGILLAECHRLGIEVQPLRVQAVKQQATGRGNADKDAMMRAAHATWPEQRVVEYDQADALWILDAGLNGAAGIQPKKAASKIRAKAQAKLQPELFNLK